MFVLIDGSSRPGSENLAPALLGEIIQGYRERVENGSPDSNHEQATDLLKEILQHAHASLFPHRVSGSASYLVAVASQGLLTIAHEGDCSAGFAVANKPVSWFTAPHCLANWKRDHEHRQLAAMPGRHRITRSFKARSKPDPEITCRAITKGETLVFATDGFWADLNDAEQIQMLDPEANAPTHVDDDISWIVVLP